MVVNVKIDRGCYRHRYRILAVLEPFCSGSATVGGDCSMRFDLEGMVVEALVARAGAAVASDTG